MTWALPLQCLDLVIVLNLGDHHMDVSATAHATTVLMEFWMGPVPRNALLKILSRDTWFLNE